MAGTCRIQGHGVHLDLEGYPMQPEAHESRRYGQVVVIQVQTSQAECFLHFARFRVDLLDRPIAFHLARVRAVQGDLPLDVVVKVTGTTYSG